MQETSTTVQTYSQEVTHLNYFVRDHRVHSVHILPGVVLLDIIYRLSLPYLGTQTIELKKILFKQPIATAADFDQKVSVIFTPQVSCWQVTVRSQRVQNGILLDTGYNDNLECLLFIRNSDNAAPEFNIQEFMANSENRWDMEEIYRHARDRGIEHGVFMKTIGSIYQQGSEELMALRLSGLAEKYRENFYAHPAFLDGSTLAGSSYGLADQLHGLRQDVTPYIPFVIKRFCIYLPLPSAIYTYSKNPRPSDETAATPPDLVSRDIRIFNESGEVLVEFERLAAKRIRESHLIKSLVQRKLDVEPRDDGSSLYQTNPRQHIRDDRSMILYLQREIGRRLRKSASEIDLQTGFYELGLDSTQLLGLVKDLECIVGEPLYPTLLLEYNTIAQLAAHLDERYKATTNDTSQKVSRTEESLGSLQLVGEEKIIYFEPVWAKRELPQRQSSFSERNRVIVLFNRSERIRASLGDHAQGVEVVALEPGVGEIPQQILIQC